MEAMIHGYHKYKSIWLNPVIQPEELLCKQEIGNACNTHAMAVSKTIDQKIKQCWMSKRKLAKKLWWFAKFAKVFYCTVVGRKKFNLEYLISKSGVF